MHAHARKAPPSPPPEPAPDKPLPLYLFALGRRACHCGDCLRCELAAMQRRTEKRRAEGQVRP